MAAAAVVEVEMQHPRLLIIEANESRLCSGPETVAAAVGIRWWRWKCNIPDY